MVWVDELNDLIFPFKSPSVLLILTQRSQGSLVKHKTTAMKRTITSILCAGIFAVTTFAQLNVQITDGDGNIQNGSTYHYYGDPSSTMHAVFLSENMSSSNIEVNVKRYETSVQPGTMNFFCWGVCYGAVPVGTNPLWISQDIVDMDPGLQYDNFSAYHQPQGNEGVSCFLYVWYDTADQNDSTWVNVCFDSETVGVEENDMIADLNVYPNPSLGSVNFDIALTASINEAELVIHNLLGERVWTRTISNNEQKIILNEGELSPGIYFYSVQANGQSGIAQKLIIARQ